MFTVALSFPPDGWQGTPEAEHWYPPPTQRRPAAHSTHTSTTSRVQQQRDSLMNYDQLMQQKITQLIKRLADNLNDMGTAHPRTMRIKIHTGYAMSPFVSNYINTYNVDMKDIPSYYLQVGLKTSFFFLQYCGLNPGPPTYKASALTLNYTPRPFYFETGRVLLT